MVHILTDFLLHRTFRGSPYYDFSFPQVLHSLICNETKWMCFILRELFLHQEFFYAKAHGIFLQCQLKYSSGLLCCHHEIFHLKIRWYFWKFWIRLKGKSLWLFIRFWRDIYMDILKYFSNLKHMPHPTLRLYWPVSRLKETAWMKLSQRRFRLDIRRRFVT